MNQKQREEEKAIEALEMNAIARQLEDSRFAARLSDGDLIKIITIAITVSKWSAHLMGAMQRAGNAKLDPKFGGAPDGAMGDVLVVYAMKLASLQVIQWADIQIAGVVLAERRNAQIAGDPGMCHFEALDFLISSDRDPTEVLRATGGDVQ